MCHSWPVSHRWNRDLYTNTYKSAQLVKAQWEYVNCDLGYTNKICFGFEILFRDNTFWIERDQENLITWYRLLEWNNFLYYQPQARLKKKPHHHFYFITCEAELSQTSDFMIGLLIPQVTLMDFFPLVVSWGIVSVHVLIRFSNTVSLTLQHVAR